MEKAILKNVAINFAGLVLPTFISLVTVPTYIHMLGVDRYGFVALVWTLIGYFGVLDFGVIHDNEMYGEIVVYYRAKGMVPPSTADRPAMGGGKKKE